MPAPISPILLIGGSGMLGRAWRELLTKRGIPFEAPPHTELDITKPATVANHLKPGVKTVINCAAWTDVDAAEDQQAGAEQLNGAAVGELMADCTKAGATLVHYSTDYVFDGGGARPWRTNDSTSPINAYGHSKRTGELLLEKSDGRFLLVRVSWLYAPWAKNFVRTIAKAARERPELKVVNDQRGRPSSSEHVAATTLALLERGATNTYHVTDGGECTWFDFATEIARHVNPACRVLPCTSAEFPRRAKRPANSVLDLSSTESALGPMPHWKDNLADVLRRLE